MMSSISPIINEGQSVQGELTRLTQCIAILEKTRVSLQKAATEAKQQIESAVSQQLTILRSRELRLRQQVDVIQQAKDALLHRQSQQLHQALGALTSFLQDSSLRELKLQEYLTCLKSLDLNPSQTAVVKFKCDPESLKEAIYQFGHIESGLQDHSIDKKRLDRCGSWRDHHFVDDDSSATSLPRLLEEYDDPEHLVLCKTLGEGKSSGPVRTRTINFSAPKISLPPKLVNKSNKMDQHKKLDVDANASTSAWICTLASDSSKRENIQEWLQQIQKHVEIEEEDGPFSTSSASIQSSFCTSITSGSLLPYFEKVFTAPTETWLNGREVGEDLSGRMRTLLQHMDSNPAHWHPQKQNQLDQGNRCRSNSCRSSPTVDIENLDQLVCSKDGVSRYFAEIERRPTFWLQPHKEMHSEINSELMSESSFEELDCLGYKMSDLGWNVSNIAAVEKENKEINLVSKWLKCDSHESKGTNNGLDESNLNLCDSKLPNFNWEEIKVPNYCRANEKCASFNECVCDVNCHPLIRGSAKASLVSSETGEWLLTEVCEFKRSENSDPGSKWLLPSDKIALNKKKGASSNEVVDCDGFSIFTRIRSDYVESWLSKPSPGVGNGKSSVLPTGKNRKLQFWLQTEGVPESSSQMDAMFRLYKKGLENQCWLVGIDGAVKTG